MRKSLMSALVQTQPPKTIMISAFYGKIGNGFEVHFVNKRLAQVSGRVGSLPNSYPLNDYDMEVVAKSFDDSLTAIDRDHEARGVSEKQGAADLITALEHVLRQISAGTFRATLHQALMTSQWIHWLEQRKYLAPNDTNGMQFATGM